MIDVHRIRAAASEWKFVLLMVAGAAAIVALAQFWEAQKSAPVKFATAKIVRFGSAPSDFGDKPLVVVRRDDGTLQTLAASSAKLSGCIKGGKIKLIEQGSTTGLADRPC
jgi:hypothetical protein